MILWWIGSKEKSERQKWRTIKGENQRIKYLYEWWDVQSYFIKFADSVVFAPLNLFLYQDFQISKFWIEYIVQAHAHVGCRLKAIFASNTPFFSSYCVIAYSDRRIFAKSEKNCEKLLKRWSVARYEMKCAKKNCVKTRQVKLLALSLNPSNDFFMAKAAFIHVFWYIVAINSTKNDRKQKQNKNVFLFCTIYSRRKKRRRRKRCLWSFSLFIANFSKPSVSNSLHYVFFFTFFREHFFHVKFFFGLFFIFCWYIRNIIMAWKRRARYRTQHTAYGMKKKL